MVEEFKVTDAEPDDREPTEPVSVPEPGLEPEPEAEPIAVPEAEPEPGEGTVIAGTAVQCRHSTGPKYFPAVVHARAHDGSYHIKYDDGDEEKGVHRRKIQLPGEKQKR